MSHVLDRIIEEVRALPQDEQRLLRELLDREQMNAKREQRAALSRQIRGKYADLATSSDDYAREKAEEIRREDRKGRKRFTSQSVLEKLFSPGGTTRE